MTLPINQPDRLNRSDLTLAILAFLFSIFLLLIAKPLGAQSLTPPLNPSNPTSSTQSTQQNQSTSNSSQANQAVPTTPAGSTYLPMMTATPTMNPGSSQSQRDANARQPGTNLNNPQLQTLPECRIEDTACIEQRNRLNQTNPQLAPTFNR